MVKPSIAQQAEWNKEGRELGIGSPYRLALYRTARSMKMTKEAALKATKECDPKVVRKFEKG